MNVRGNEGLGAISEGRAPKSGLMLATDVLAVVYAGYVSAGQGARLDITEYLISGA